MLIQRKRTWQECTNEKILSIYKEVIDEAKRLYPQYFDCRLRFFLDSSTKHLGFCKTEIKKETCMSQFGFPNHLEYLRYDDAVIVLSKYVTDEKTIRSVLVHEVGHFVSPKEHHSYLWKTRANKIGAKFGITCRRLANEEEVKTFQKTAPKKQTKEYAVVCKGCGKIVKRQRMCSIIEYPELWKCGNCGSHFERIK